MDSTEFVRTQFSHYYERVRNRIFVPEISKREFGAGVVDKIDYRHKAFPNVEAFSDFLVRDAPLYCSYSTARYDTPAAPTMAKKGMLGQDLVFDLDKQYGEEHPDRHSKVFCRHCLKRATEDATRFYEEFLVGDFGFSKDEVKINFSGSKGFHFHVRSGLVQQFSPDARKELCDYAAAFEVSGEKLLNSNAVVEGTRTQKNLRGPSASSGGWPLRVYKYISDKYSKMEEPDFEKLAFTKKVKRMLLDLKPAALERIANGNYNYPDGTDSLWLALANEAIAHYRIELDKPVSFDKSRLIRVPNTLHGDSGLIAKEIPSLDGFRPDFDCVAFNGTQTIIPVEDATPAVEFGNGSYTLRQGVAKEVPLALAILLLRKGRANLPE